MQTFEDFDKAVRLCVDAFNEWAKRMNPAARADHVCYKCADSGEFEHVRALFECRSQFVYQSEIAGRRIAIIKFREPIATALGEIWFFELSDQKPDGNQKSGFDHIEIYPVVGEAETLVEQLSGNGAIFTKTVRPHHTTFDTAIAEGFGVRLEAGPLLETIKREMSQAAQG